MSINVKDVQQPGTHAAGAAAGKGASAVTSGAAVPDAKKGAGVGGDSVSLTQAGLQLAQMEQQLAKQPSVDSQRVEQVRQKLQSGNYSIDPARIANKLLGFEFPSKS
jgi:negative regulator of flagellin synthesis FlgM